MRISIRNLSKVYDKDTAALSDINLELENGQYALIGPNASGKTTLIRILATLLKPTSGTVTIDGLDLQKNRAAIRFITGYLPQRFSDFTRIKTREYLDYTASLSGLRDRRKRNAEVEELLFSLGLQKYSEVPANELSPSSKRHLEIGQAMIGSPRILLVDEPTAGLSPEERIRFNDLLSGYMKKTEIIIMTTHIFSDISSTCSGVAVLDRGGLVYFGSPEILSGEMNWHS